MFGLWRNNDYKKMIIHVLMLFGAMLLFLGLILALFLNGVKRGIIEQEASFAAIVHEKHPELEDELISAIRGEIQAGDPDTGYAVLKQYGFDKNLAVGRTPILKDVYWTAVVAGVSLLLALLFGTCFIITKRSRILFSRIDEISSAAGKVVDGDFSQKLPSEGEGSFAILGHCFNQMTNRLKLTVENLKSVKSFLKDIIADISHQLKTPLSTLIINQDLLLANPGMDAATRIGFLESGSHQLSRLQWLIQSLLKMARLESGSIVFKNERVLLSDVVHEAFDTLQAAARDSSVTLVRPPEVEDAYCFGDRDWLIEALVNIVKNSVEHTGPGGSVTISLFQSRLFSGITITDNGEGIDPKDTPHIFERFYRGSGTKKPTSVGIGLSLSKAIIEGHGGSIRVQSEKGRGSEFTITFILNG
jgi:signal transduction histidine kinase